MDIDYRNDLEALGVDPENYSLDLRVFVNDVYVAKARPVVNTKGAFVLVDVQEESNDFSLPTNISQKVFKKCDGFIGVFYSE